MDQDEYLFDMGYFTSVMQECMESFEKLESFEQARVQNVRLMVISSQISSRPILAKKDCTGSIKSTINSLNKKGSKVARRLNLRYTPYIATIRKAISDEGLRMRVLTEQLAQFELL